MKRGIEYNWPARVLADYPDGGVFVVPAGMLGLNVLVFCICAVACLGMLMARRVFLGAELGGKKVTCMVSSAAMGSLWFVYIGVSIAVEGSIFVD